MSSGMPFGELMSLFQPGLAHLVEEQERKRTELVVPGDSDKDWDVDLDSGVATLGGTTEADHPDAGDDGRP